MEHESSAMLQGRYVPLLQFKGALEVGQGGVVMLSSCMAAAARLLPRHPHHLLVPLPTCPAILCCSYTAGVGHEELLICA